MKKVFLLNFLLVFFSSCKKQELKTDNPMIGKWRVSEYTIENKCMTAPSYPGWQVNQPLKKVDIEIFDTGKIKVAFDGKIGASVTFFERQKK